MTPEKAREFYEEHKHKIGKDFRLEVLKLSKEDMYDFMDNHFSDLIHGWRQRLHEEINKVQSLQTQVDVLTPKETTNKVDYDVATPEQGHHTFKSIVQWFDTTGKRHAVHSYDMEVTETLMGLLTGNITLADLEP